MPRDWISKTVMITATLATMVIAGCPYNLSGSWEGTCEVDGELLVSDPYEDIWTDVSFEFDLSLEITEQQAHFWGDADGDFLYWVEGIEALGAEVTFDVTGSRYDTWAEIALEGDGYSEGVNLQLDGRVYRDAVVGECRVELEGWMADLDNGDFQLYR